MRTDPVADLLTRIRNAQSAGHKVVHVLKSTLGARVLEVLKIEGFIESYVEKENAETKFSEYEVFLKYYSGGQPALSSLKRMSKPGRRSWHVRDPAPP